MFCFFRFFLERPALDSWLSGLWQRIANALNAVNSVFRTFESCTIRFCWLGVMLMPWDSSQRKKRFNKGWARTRVKVLERDGYRCQWPVTDANGFPAGKCGRPANEVDHMNQNMVHDDDRLNRLWSLCHEHHNIKTQVESTRGKRRAAERRRDAAFFEHPAFR